MFIQFKHVQVVLKDVALSHIARRLVTGTLLIRDYKQMGTYNI